MASAQDSSIKGRILEKGKQVRAAIQSSTSNVPPSRNSCNKTKLRRTTAEYSRATVNQLQDLMSDAESSPTTNALTDFVVHSSGHYASTHLPTDVVVHSSARLSEGTHPLTDFVVESTTLALTHRIVESNSLGMEGSYESIPFGRLPSYDEYPSNCSDDSGDTTNMIKRTQARWL